MLVKAMLNQNEEPEKVKAEEVAGPANCIMISIDE